MKRLLLLSLALLAAPIAAEPLSRSDHAIIMSIADSLGIPRSVADRLQIEESGNPKTGAWGDSEAVSHPGAGGFRSRGLFGISMRWEAALVALYFPHAPALFDWRDPIDSAVVGLGYLAALHRRFGTWYLAAIYYNFGRLMDVPEGTRAYARRIVAWPGTPKEPEPSFEDTPEAFRGAARWEWMQEPGGPR